MCFVLDDFAMAPLKDSERHDFLEICDDRYQRRSIILPRRGNLWVTARVSEPLLRGNAGTFCR